VAVTVIMYGSQTGQTLEQEVADAVEEVEVVLVGAVVEIAMQLHALEYFEGPYVVATKVGNGLPGPWVYVEQKAAA
jgi:predicted TIM-barrel enzyme